MGMSGQLNDPFVIGRSHIQLFEWHGGTSSEDTQNGALTLYRGNRGYTKFKLLAPHFQLTLAILGQTLLGDVQPRHYLDTGNQGGTVFLGNLDNFPTQAVHTNSYPAGSIIFTRLDVNIGSTETIRFGNDAIYQLDDRRGSGQTFIFIVIIALLHLDASVVVHIGEDVIETFFIITAITASQELDDVFRQANPECIVAGVHYTLDFHDALIVRGVIDKNDRLLFVTRNRKPQVAAQIADANIFQQVSREFMVGVVLHVRYPVIVFQRLADHVGFDVILFH